MWPRDAKCKATNSQAQRLATSGVDIMTSYDLALMECMQAARPVALFVYKAGLIVWI
jgi:hypothetical protein